MKLTVVLCNLLAPFISDPVHQLQSVEIHFFCLAPLLFIYLFWKNSMLLNLIYIESLSSAGAMRRIQSAYGVVKDWAADPCVPRNYSWDGVEISYDDNSSPTVVSL